MLCLDSCARGPGRHIENVRRWASAALTCLCPMLAATGFGQDFRIVGFAPGSDYYGNARPADLPGLGGEGSGSTYDIGVYELPPDVSFAVYVAQSGDGTAGTNWVTAFTNVQTALSHPYAAYEGVWIKAGIYAITNPIVLTNNVALYGGFAGHEIWRGEKKHPIKILDQHACIGTRNDVAANLIRLIDACKHEILMQNSYVVLSDALTEALKRASARGVKIILHTNSGASTDAMSCANVSWMRCVSRARYSWIIASPG